MSLQDDRTKIHTLRIHFTDGFWTSSCASCAIHTFPFAFINRKNSKTLSVRWLNQYAHSARAMCVPDFTDVPQMYICPFTVTSVVRTRVFSIAGFSTRRHWKMNIIGGTTKIAIRPRATLGSSLDQGNKSTKMESHGTTLKGQVRAGLNAVFSSTSYFSQFASFLHSLYNFYATFSRIVTDRSNYQLIENAVY